MSRRCFMQVLGYRWLFLCGSKDRWEWASSLVLLRVVLKCPGAYGFARGLVSVVVFFIHKRGHVICNPPSTDWWLGSSSSASLIHGAPQSQEPRLRTVSSSLVLLLLVINSEKPLIDGPAGLLICIWTVGDWQFRGSGMASSALPGKINNCEPPGSK